MRVKTFKEEFYYFLNKFKNKENFNLLRFSDGEMYILQNKKIELSAENVHVEDVVSSKDGFYSTNTMLRPDYDQKLFNPIKHSLFRDYLIGSFLHTDYNYYKGISCKCCVGLENFNWQINQLGGDSDNITWSNVMLNSNYPLFLKEFYPLLKSRGVYVVCNEKANIDNISWIKGYIKVGTDIFDNFENYIIEIKKFIEYNKINNEVFLFSASSLSNVIQYELSLDFPTNTYIDIGTTLSHEFGIPILRGYIQDYFNGNLDRLQSCIW
jgi:hypothetical protein